MKQSRRSMLLGACAGIGALAFGAAWKNAGAVPAEAGAGADKKGEGARVIRIQAKKFEYTPNEIRVKKGEKIMLELTALDFVHGFNLPDFKIRADIPPGKATMLALNPTETGRFTFLCDNFCGDGHEEMNGILIVE